MQASSDVAAEVASAARHLEANEPHAAERVYRGVLREDSENAAAHDGLGLALIALGRLDEAADSHARAVALAPMHGERHWHLGAVKLALGQHDDAIVALERACVLDGTQSQWWRALGIALNHERRHDEACGAFARVVALEPSIPDLYLHFTEALLGATDTPSRDREQAIVAGREACRRQPQGAKAWLLLARALMRADRFDEAVTSLRAGLACAPRSVEAHRLMSSALGKMGEFDAAEQALARAVELSPDDALIRAEIALLLLARGDYTRGLREYEFRLQLPAGQYREEYAIPRWRGEELRGCRLLLRHEQGFGDCIMFVRFASMLAARGAEVTVSCPPALARLLKTAAGVSRVLTTGEPLPEFDFQVPVGSAPLLLGITADTIPATVPYVAADAAQVSAWNKRFVDIVGLKVGLVWAGRPEHADNHLRSIAPALLTPLGNVPHVHFFSLQKAHAQASCTPVPGFAIADCTGELEDFADTAALIGALDLVISVDTATAHLAGALGRPVWLLNRFAGDWRWFHARSDSPWYPTMVVYNQGACRAWQPVVAEVARDLTELAARMTSERIERYKDLGLRLISQKRYVEALAAFDTVLAVRADDVTADADNAAAHDGLGLALLALGRLDEAAASHARAVVLAPARAEMHWHLGAVKLALGQYDDAISALQRACDLDGAQAQWWNALGTALNNHAVVLIRARRLEEALACLQRAKALRPADVNILNNLGAALRHLGSAEDSLAHYEQALALDHGSADAHCGRGLALRELGNVAGAIEAYRAALERDSNHADAHLNLGIACLFAGDYANGWREYEWRWRVATAEQRRYQSKLQWGGEDLSGRRILIWSEQGFGDTIQFCRFARTLAARGAKVVLEVPAVLRELMNTLDGVFITTPGELHLSCEFHCPLMSVPFHLQCSGNDLGMNTPYLHADSARLAHWERRLSTAKPKIGIACSGNENHRRDLFRSLPLHSFAPLLQLPFAFYYLQPECRPEDERFLLEERALEDLRSDLLTFADTAAVIANLDLVISVDTAVVHLAGAMGKPVWVMLAAPEDWRWMEAGASSPWYPSARLFRRERAASWDTLMSVLCSELRARFLT